MIDFFRKNKKTNSNKKEIIIHKSEENTTDTVQKINWTSKIIHDSDHHWYDSTYYDDVGSLTGVMGRKKRKVKTIALYYWRLHDGGTERVTCRLTSYLCNLGYNVIILSDIEKNKKDYTYDHRVKRYTLPLHRERYTNRGRVLSGILINENVDLFITNLWVETATAWDLFVAKTLDIPVVIGWHNVFDAGIYGGYDINFFRLRLKAYKYADAVICLSKMDQYWFKNQHISSRLIPNPLTFDALPNSVSELNNKKIIWIGRVEQHQKRIFDAIRMMSILLEEVPDAQLVVVGDGPDRIKAEKLSRELGIHSNINFIGYSQNVQDHIKDASLHILTSEFEGSPMVLGEVWSYGVPTVMYDLAYLEWLRDGKGFLSNYQQDYEGMAKNVATILKDKSYHKKLATEAREISEKFFNIDLEKIWGDFIKDIEYKEDLSDSLNQEDVDFVAPLLIQHLYGRMYEVDERKTRHDLFINKNKKNKSITKKALYLAREAKSNIPDFFPKLNFRKLRTIDLSWIGLGDNLMAWIGLYALASRKVPFMHENCIIYVPKSLYELATFVFDGLELNIQGVEPHSKIKSRSPVFSPLPPLEKNIAQWIKNFIGSDWRINCFEAIDLQKSIPRQGFTNTKRTRLRLNLSEIIIHRNWGWKNSSPGYIGYRLWLPIARKFNISPVVFLAMIKSDISPIRDRVQAWVDKSAEPSGISDTASGDRTIAIFPAGKSFQAFPAEACKDLESEFKNEQANFYVHADDPWIRKMYASGINIIETPSIISLFKIIRSAKSVITTDSFTSHIAQLLRDDFVLVLTRDFKENILHPGANPIIVANHPKCAPCNYHPRMEDSKCVAKFSHCIAFDNKYFIKKISNYAKNLLDMR